MTVENESTAKHKNDPILHSAVILGDGLADAGATPLRCVTPITSPLLSSKCQFKSLLFYLKAA